MICTLVVGSGCWQWLAVKQNNSAIYGAMYIVCLGSTPPRMRARTHTHTRMHSHTGTAVTGSWLSAHLSPCRHSWLL